MNYYYYFKSSFRSFKNPVQIILMLRQDLMEVVGRQQKKGEWAEVVLKLLDYSSIGLLLDVWAPAYKGAAWTADTSQISNFSQFNCFYSWLCTHKSWSEYSASKSTFLFGYLMSKASQLSVFKFVLKISLSNLLWTHFPRLTQWHQHSTKFTCQEWLIIFMFFLSLPLHILNS